LPYLWLYRYAKRADPAIDEWLASLPPDALHHQDTLLALAAAAERGDEKALACWNEVTRTAPVGVRVTEEEWAAGSTFFWENGLPLRHPSCPYLALTSPLLPPAGLIFTSLLHFSLAGGFSAPRITRHLHAASYLIPPVDKTGLSYCPMSTASRDRTRGRLAETGQFVLDVMGCPYVASRFSLECSQLEPDADEFESVSAQIALARQRNREGEGLRRHSTVFGRRLPHTTSQGLLLDRGDR
jgi:hypothetical protein